MFVEAHLWWFTCEIREWLAHLVTPAVVLLESLVSPSYSTLAFTGKPIYEEGSNVVCHCI